MYRRFQFSLRALLIAMLVVGAFFGGHRVGVRQERERFSAEVAVEQKRRADEITDLMKRWTARPPKKDTEGYAEMGASLDEIEAEVAR